MSKNEMDFGFKSAYWRSSIAWDVVVFIVGGLFGVLWISVVKPEADIPPISGSTTDRTAVLADFYICGGMHEEGKLVDSALAVPELEGSAKERAVQWFKGRHSRWQKHCNGVVDRFCYLWADQKHSNSLALLYRQVCPTNLKDS